jgi:DNA-binding transcriptional LysR family regulator
VELPQLEYFRVLGRMQHVTRAAETLGITQPTLSRAMARLERDLGVPLFEPAGRSVKLSAYGVAFLTSVERALDELAAGRARVAAMSGAERGTVALGFLRSLAPRYVPDLTRRFSELHPDVRFVLTDDRRDRLNEQLIAGRIALCVTVRSADPRIAWHAMARQELVVVVPPDHRLARAGHVPLAALAGERLVAFRHGYPINAQIEALLRAAGLSLPIAAEGEESGSVRGLVAAGAGVAIVPRSGASDDLPALTIDDRGAAREIGLAWVAGRYASPAEIAFRDFVVANYAPAAASPADAALEAL